MEEYIDTLNLAGKPRKILQLMETHTEGAAQEVIQAMMAYTPAVSMEDVQDVWHRLVELFATPDKIAKELTLKIVKFPPISEQNAGLQLSKLYDLCKTLEHNIPRCSDLSDYNIAKGLNEIRIKLPVSVQKQWRDRGLAYEAQRGCHPHLLSLLSSSARSPAAD